MYTADFVVYLFPIFLHISVTSCKGEPQPRASTSPLDIDWAAH